MLRTFHYLVIKPLLAGLLAMVAFVAFITLVHYIVVGIGKMGVFVSQYVNLEFAYTGFCLLVLAWILGIVIIGWDKLRFHLEEKRNGNQSETL